MQDLIEHFENYGPKTLPFDQWLADVLEVPLATVQPFLGKIQYRKVEKNEFLIMPGTVCPYTYYVERGVLRMYTIDGSGKEHVIQFAPEGWYITDRKSTYLDEPSSYFIQAIEDCDLALIPKHFLQDISKKYPQLLEKNTFILNRYIMLLQHRVTLLLSATAEERYLDFLSTYKDFIHRVPLYMLASYLGITPESLSRVRNELAKG